MIYLESHYLQVFKKEIDEWKIIIEKRDKKEFRKMMSEPLKIDALMKMSLFESNSFNFIITELCKEIISLSICVEHEYAAHFKFSDYFEGWE